MAYQKVTLSIAAAAFGAAGLFVLNPSQALAATPTHMTAALQADWHNHEHHRNHNRNHNFNFNRNHNRITVVIVDRDRDRDRDEVK
jgi:hypothetical protein